MKNISFDNPYLLLTAIPALVILFCTFFWAIRKDNRSKAPVISFIIHIIVIILAVLALAGTVVTTVMTETGVYVVADVSYSSNRNLDKVDEYIDQVSKKLPFNSKMGIVCFGKDHTLLTALGEEIRSVKDADVDDSGTDIASAIDYAASLFEEGVIKRIVLITDGKQTDAKGVSRLIASIENLYAEGIYIDTVFLDNNITSGQSEVQISGVDYIGSTYMNHEASADALVLSSAKAQAIVSLYKNLEKIDEKAVSLTEGYNVVNFDLHTDIAGSFDYQVKISSQGDYSHHNNSYSFTQTVTSGLSVLLVTSSEDDVEKAKQLYGENAVIDAYVNESSIPCSIEDICKYDEIIISGVDVREVQNYTAFIDAVDKAVSLFGKSLVTMGDLKIQNKTDEVLKQLENMLPVRFGNNENDPKVYGIVIDTSRSMINASHLIMAKQSAIQLLGLLGDEDYVTVVSFSGDITVVQTPTKAKNRNEIIDKINALQPTQGTFIGKALEETYQLMTSLSAGEKQVMLISDGMSYTLENDDPVEVAAKLKDAGIVTSAINTSSYTGIKPLEEIALAGGGEYYYIQSEESLEELIFSEIADDITETVIERGSPVFIDRPNDSSVEGVTYIPDVEGYVYSKAKASATTVLHTQFIKPSSRVTEPPIFAYWSYGNGRVSTLTTSLSGAWTASWTGRGGDLFLEKMLEAGIPKERIDHPYTLSVEYDGQSSRIEIIPALLNPYALAEVKVTSPDGQSSTKQLTFDSEKYYYSFETPLMGKYGIDITYAYDDKSYTASSSFCISYSPEYDAFAVFDPSDLHTAIRSRGSVNEGFVPKLENDESEIATYKMYFTAPFLIAAVILFLIDIMIRKLKWNDIKGIFVSKAKGKGR